MDETLKKFLKTFCQKFKANFGNISWLKIRILLDFCLITLIGIIIFRNFLFTDKWPAGGDALGIVSRAYIFGKDLRWLYVWRPHSFGFVEVIHGYDFFLMVLHWVFMDAITTAKVFLFLTFIVSGFSSYTLAYWYTKNPTASLAAALVYTLNQWLFTQYTEAHGDILFSYALAPFLFLSLFKAFETKKLKNILVAGLALGVFASAFHPECVVIYGASFPIFALVYLLMSSKNANLLKKLKNFFSVTLLLTVICFALAAFMLIPMIFNVRPIYYSSAYKYFVEETIGGVYKNLTHAFALGAVEKWGYVNAVDVETGLSMPDFPAKQLSLILFSLAYCTVFVRKNKYTVFFILSAFFGMFIAKGSNPPFGFLYLWAWFNVPHFAVFRAGNRWVMLTCLSHAFLMAMLVDILTSYIKEKKYSVIEKEFSRLSARIAKYLKTQRKQIPLKVTKNFFVHLHKALHCLSILLLIAIFLNGFFTTWYFFREGLQVYSLPESYVKPYEWIGLQSGDFKVVSVNRGPGRWENDPYSGFDFGFGGMMTDIGWAHDIGFESSFIHDRPVMQDGGWNPNAHAFVDYLRFQLARQKKTSDFLKLVGLFNYKYVVLPAYLDPDIKDFFLNQKGAVEHIVYDENGSLIIENPYSTPRFFGVCDYINVLGGFGSFPALCKIETFNLNQTSLFFLDNLDNESFNELQNNATALVFVNAGLIDLVMLQLRDKAEIINAGDFGVYSYNTTKYWVQCGSWRNVGALVYGGKTLTTCGNVSIDIPFEVSTDETYDVWLRIGFLSYRGNLSVLIDGNLLGKIKPEADYWCGLIWVKMQSLYLKKGRHVLTLWNDGTGFNDVDAIAVVEPTFFQAKYEELLNFLETFRGRIVDVIGAVNLFAYDLPEGWTIGSQQYEEDLLKAEKTLTAIRVNASASASSTQNDFLPQNAVDGSLETRWASDPSQATPQWLQVEWPTAQEVAGVKIFFETAYAKDYTIKTWNGTQWITQLDVSGNMLITPLHMFKEPVKTDKLLLTVNAYGTGHHLVSIFELELCKLSSITVNHFIPKTSKYMLALRLATGPDYGTLNLRVADNSLMFNCSGLEENFQWYEAGPIFLEKGEQEFTIEAYGKILFDQIILYSLKENENVVSIQNIFDSDENSPIIHYEKLNPTYYKVHVKTEQPFFLVFSETYHPLWKAKLENGQEISSTIAFSFVNSFYVNATGEFNIDVFFAGQWYADIGLKISLTSLIFITVAVLTPRNISERIKSRLAVWKVKTWLSKVRKK